MGWLYVGSVLTRARVNVSPGWSAHSTMEETLVPENKHVKVLPASHSHRGVEDVGHEQRDTHGDVGLDQVQHLRFLVASVMKPCPVWISLKSSRLEHRWLPTRVPSGLRIESKVTDLVLVKNVLVSTSLMGLVTPSDPVGALTSQRY
ncbi:hypothetical protein EYF80_000107 [Liparis tanakae]|uniref:Uncharacterized protein n=1 Tax=Liparis tanakae TaxID=230148 RepID=A0A4Z2JIC1_9TELE|nr:hypothetical protein EYF80_000107 [Liparis tanakae]